jgi:PD-(D/E)XK endonuclease
MSDDFCLGMDDVGVVGVGESITIFAGVERRKAKRVAAAKTDSSGLAALACRNDKDLGPFARRNDRGVRLRSVRDDEILRKMEPKELGELAEAEFLRTVLKMGMAVTKPWGESEGYDFIVDAAGKLTRVQVKAAFCRGKQGGYSLRTYRSSMECYTEKEIDALAGYVSPEDAWYLFPVREVRKVRSLKLFPGSKNGRSKFEKWREAWWVVTGK